MTSLTSTVMSSRALAATRPIMECTFTLALGQHINTVSGTCLCTVYGWSLLLAPVALILGEMTCIKQPPVYSGQNTGPKVTTIDRFHCIAVWLTVMHCIAVWLTVMHCIAVWLTVMHCIAVWLTVMHCIAVWLTVMHCIAVWLT